MSSNVYYVSTILRNLAQRPLTQDQDLLSLLQPIHDAIFELAQGITSGGGGGGGGGQIPLQFQEEGVNLGTSGTVDVINFLGVPVTASRSGNTISITIGAKRHFYGPAAPSGAVPGDEWVDTTTGIMYTRIDDGSSSQWVEFSANISGGGGSSPVPVGSYFRASRGTTVSGTTGTDIDQIFNNELSDPRAVYNPATGICTIPEDGNWIFGAEGIIRSDAGNVSIKGAIRSGAAEFAANWENLNLNEIGGISITTGVLAGLKAGDAIRFAVTCPTAYSLFAGSTFWGFRHS